MGEPVLGLLPELVAVPNAAVPPLMQWECPVPRVVYVKAPGNAATPRLQVHFNTIGRPPARISFQETNRRGLSTPSLTLTHRHSSSRGSELLCDLAGAVTLQEGLPKLGANCKPS